LKKFEKLVEAYRDDIVKKWIDFFVYNKEIISELSGMTMKCVSLSGISMKGIFNQKSIYYWQK